MKPFTVTSISVGICGHPAALSVVPGGKKARFFCMQSGTVMKKRKRLLRD
jgi:hypothetical protein